MELDDQTVILGQADFFTVCTEEQRRLLAFASEQRSFAAGETVFARDMPSDGAYVLISGMVRLSGSATSSQKGKVADQPGTIFGELGLLLSNARRGTLKAVTDSRLLFVPRSAFVKLVHQYPDLAQRTAARLQSDLDQFLGEVTRFAGKVEG